MASFLEGFQTDWMSLRLRINTNSSKLINSCWPRFCLSEAEDFVKKGNLKVVELKEQIAHNTVDIEKMRRQEEDTLRNTIQAQERTDNLKAQLKHKGGLSL